MGGGVRAERGEASGALGVGDGVSSVSLPTGLLAHGLCPIRALGSVQSVRSRTRTSSGTAAECLRLPPPFRLPLFPTEPLDKRVLSSPRSETGEAGTGEVLVPGAGCPRCESQGSLGLPV